MNHVEMCSIGRAHLSGLRHKSRANTSVERAQNRTQQAFHNATENPDSPKTSANGMGSCVSGARIGDRRKMDM